MRAALVPDVPHIEPWISLAVLAGSIIVLSLVGVRGFYRRAID
jgi:ABC-2 type transport system permease protein